MRVLVTGHRGYIGSVMTCVLRHARFDVVGLDCDLYRGCDFGRVSESVPSFDADIREMEVTDLLSFDAIVHLAHVPECVGSPTRRRAGRVNENITLDFARRAKEAGVATFLFASGCEVYGRGNGSPLGEDSPTDPKSPGACSKLRCERGLLALADRTFVPVFLRHGEVYGVSPRLRLDLLVNDFVGSGVTRGRVTMQSGAAGWRSLIHVEDLCRAYAAVLTAPDDRVRGQAFNVATPGQQYRVIDLADTVAEMLPYCTRSPVVDPYDDNSRRVEVAKFVRAFPQWRPRWELPTGIRQLQCAMHNAGLTPADWRCDRFRRAAYLAGRLERRRVDATFRPCRQVPA